MGALQSWDVYSTVVQNFYPKHCETGHALGTLTLLCFPVKIFESFCPEVSFILNKLPGYKWEKYGLLRVCNEDT